MQKQNEKILVVEDDSQIRNFVCFALKQAGFGYSSAATAQDALTQLVTGQFDLMLLDLGLPDFDGMQVIAKVRSWSQVPILVISARDQDTEKAAALDAGADDYLTKPFHPEELQLRVQALLRRSHGHANQPVLTSAGLQLDEGRQCVTRDGVDIQLTAAEFRLLRYFMLHPQQILSKSHLSEHLYDGETERDSNVLEVHVNHLRRKLGRDVIETRRGQGYIFGSGTL